MEKSTKCSRKENTKSRLSRKLFISSSVFKTGKHFYLQVLLDECKYTIQEKKFLSMLSIIEKFLLILMEKTLKKKILMKKEENFDEEN